MRAWPVSALLEGLQGRIAAEPREGLELRLAGRQALRLLVGDHLQAVLDGAQEAVGLRRARRAPRAVIQPSSCSATSMSRVRRPAQGRPAAAEDELLRLHEELDLADAAASELDVVTRDRDLVVPAHRMDLPLHRVHVGDRRRNRNTCAR